MNETLVGYGAIFFCIGVFVGMMLVNLMLHLEKLDWVRTRVYYYGVVDGYKAGYEDGSNKRDFNPHSIRWNLKR